MTGDLKVRLTRHALDAGFSSIGITTPKSVPHVKNNLQEFIGAGFHGQMGWLQERTNWRGDPSALWPEAKSIIMLAEVYSPVHDPTSILKMPDRGAISVYAQNRDYHDIVKKRLKRVGRWLLEQAEGEIKVFVDTAPVMEKPLGQAAGLGWQGKHTNLLSRDLGNWFFLGCIFTTIAFEPDEPVQENCGSCRACLDICPTDAFPEPYKLDARRCISYLTIEHQGPVDKELRGKMGNHIYGCDDCLAVCPWNKFAVAAKETKYAARPDLVAPALAELSQLDDQAFRNKFSGSPIKRIGRNRFVRNVLYAIGNSDDGALLQSAQRLLHDADDSVADAASWAAAQLHKKSGD